MGPPSYAYFDELKPRTREDVIGVVKKHFLPVGIETKLLTELFDVNMVNIDFHTYYTTFNAYRRHLAFSDDCYFIVVFTRGLEPHHHHAVVTARPTTLAHAIRGCSRTPLQPTSSLDAIYANSVPATSSSNSRTARAVLAASWSVHPTTTPISTSTHYFHGL